MLRPVFGQISGHHGLARLIHRINHKYPFPQKKLAHGYPFWRPLRTLANQNQERLRSESWLSVMILVLFFLFAISISASLDCIKIYPFRNTITIAYTYIFNAWYLKLFNTHDGYLWTHSFFHITTMIISPSILNKNKIIHPSIFISYSLLPTPQKLSLKHSEEHKVFIMITYFAFKLL